MRVVFWQNELGGHQAAAIKALAEHPNVEVIWVAEKAIYPERQELGWEVPDTGKAQILILPDAATIQKLVDHDPDNSVHIFNTFRSYPMVREAFRRCLPTGARMGVFSESGDFRGWKGIARRILGYSDHLRFGRRISFVLACGQMGVHWFERCGFPRRQIYPYGYFVDRPLAALHSRSEEGPFTITFVGQYVTRKGVDLLLRALSACPDREWRLVCIGHGEQEAAWSALALRLGVADRVRLLPVKPNQDAIAEIARSDLFVLPSRFDGWGAVVNEALMCGVPVVCSSHCGAQELLREVWRGEVFPAGSVAGLRDMLRRRMAQGKRTPEQTARIQTWSESIEGHVIAVYLMQIITHASGYGPRPSIPWENLFYASGIGDRIDAEDWRQLPRQRPEKRAAVTLD